jgi:agarase
MRLLPAFCAWLVSVLLLNASSADAASGFYGVKQVEGRWYLVDPQGNLFFSTGVTTVDFNQDIIHGTTVQPYGGTCQAKYGSVDAWRKAVAASLFGWGFNTLGAWSDTAIAKVDVDGRHLAYTPVLALGAGFVSAKVKGGQAWLKGIFPDVFDPDFPTYCQARAQKSCAPHKDDPNLLGWFTDNEMRWGPDWRGGDELLVTFLNLPPHTPGRDAALHLLQARYPEVAQFNAVWGTSLASWDDTAQPVKFVTPPGAVRKAVIAQNADVARTTGNANAAAFIADCDAFLTLLADRYFHVVRDAIKTADPNHLVIGCRFARVPAPPAIVAAARYMDVISANCYTYDPTPALTTYAAQKKPILIGEFAFRARDSGMPNTQGAGPLVDTQQERADAFAAYVRAALAQPALVGYQWFEHADEPKEGRFDGENSNYGLVNIHDDPYVVLVTKMTEINRQALALHQQAPVP